MILFAMKVTKFIQPHGKVEHRHGTCSADNKLKLRITGIMKENINLVQMNATAISLNMKTKFTENDFD